MQKTPEPSPQLMNLVKAGFVAQGTTLSAWCRAQNRYPSNVRQTLLGSWNGPIARELRAQVCRAARIREAA